MCGRYSAAGKLSELAKFVDFVLKAPVHLPRYNIAPRQTAPVIISANGRPALTAMRWGLIPAWAEDETIGDKLINARSETVFNKPSFRGAIKQRRCLIPADGFYEWQRQAGDLQPYRFTLQGRGWFCFAGVWETWRRPPVTGEFDFGASFDQRPTELETFSILTTQANSVLAPVHDRMPVIVPVGHHAEWLDHGQFDVNRLATLFRPYPDGEMQAVQVSKWVNQARHEGPDCILPG